jgi:hypothetical protein
MFNSSNILHRQTTLKFLHLPFSSSSWACDEKIHTHCSNDMIWCSFACEVLGMTCYLYYAISESNPVVSMPLSSELKNKWWLLCFWGLCLPSYLDTISKCWSIISLVNKAHIDMCIWIATAMFTSCNILHRQTTLKFWHLPFSSSWACDEKFHTHCSNDMIWCSFACEVLGMTCYLYYAISESNPVVSMPLSSELKNKWWLVCFWGL